MDQEKKNNLEEKGWKMMTVGEFLGLTPEEETLIQLKLENSCGADFSLSSEAEKSAMQISRTK